MIKQFAILLLIAFTLFSCHNKTSPPVIYESPKGEFAFLLQYNKRIPADIGFLTNHVVERRIANLLKDSFQVFMGKTEYAMPLWVDTGYGMDNLVVGAFYADSIFKKPSALVLIDVTKDALWVDYMNGDSIVSFADNPSLKKPDPFRE